MIKFNTHYKAEKLLIILFLLGSYALNAFELSPAKETFKLGFGGSGIVTLGQYDKNNNQYLALKVLHIDLDRIISKESDSGPRLVNEICANLELGNLKHISRGIAAGLTEDKHIYFALVPSLGGRGQDSFDYFTNNPSELKPEWIRFLIANVALGLDSIHKSGWSWLDNNLKNILIDYDTGYMKIIDFGQSKRPNDLTEKTEYRSINEFTSIDDWDSLGRYVLKKLLDINLDKSGLTTNLLLLQEALIGRGENSVDNLHTIEDLKNHIAFKDFKWENLENGDMISPFIPKNNPMYISFLYSKNPKIEELLISGKLESYTMKRHESFIVDPGLFDLLKKVPFKRMAEGLGSQISTADNIEDVCKIHKEFFKNIKNN